MATFAEYLGNIDIDDILNELENVNPTPGHGGVITAKKGSKVQTVTVNNPMTREEIEAVFSDI